MKNGWKLMTLFGLLGALAVSAMAADMSPALKANVPFGFTAGNVSFPAGHYMIERHSAPGVVMIRAEEGPVAAVRVNSAQARRTNAKPKLIFRKYGENYFLAQIWNAGAAGFELPKSRREKEMLAKGEPAEEIVVALLR